MITNYLDQIQREQRVELIQSKDKFIQQTKSIWSFSTESARRVNHPAPFPVELPKRCIEMFTFLGDIVFDPFLGSGTTAVAAKQTGRVYIGCDILQEYCDIAEQRLKSTEEYLSELIKFE